MTGGSAPLSVAPPAVEPLTARSVALSTLLGYHPPALPIRALIRVGRLFDIADQTMRTALSRMLAAGDVTSTEGGVYQLSRRLVERQARQEITRSPTATKWDGAWQLAIVTAPPRPLADRTALRRAMSQMRMAELREGTWMRPDNLVQNRPQIAAEQCTFFNARSDDPDFGDPDLAGRLWDLPGWADEARELSSALTSVGDLKTGFLISIEVIRHLLLDPCLPVDLLPADWPAVSLRSDYDRFHTMFAAQLKDYSQG
jgi:phenylacetic acid degradation operon negative regulatory protein